MWLAGVTARWRSCFSVVANFEIIVGKTAASKKSAKKMADTEELEVSECAL